MLVSQRQVQMLQARQPCSPSLSQQRCVPVPRLPSQQARHWVPAASSDRQAAPDVRDRSSAPDLADEEPSTSGRGLVR